MVHKSLETSSAPPRPPASSKVGDDGAFEGDEELADLGIDSRRVARRRLRAGHEVQGLREMARKKKRNRHSRGTGRDHENSHLALHCHGHDELRLGEHL